LIRKSGYLHKIKSFQEDSWVFLWNQWLWVPKDNHGFLNWYFIKYAKEKVFSLNFKVLFSLATLDQHMSEFHHLRLNLLVKCCTLLLFQWGLLAVQFTWAKIPKMALSNVFISLPMLGLHVAYKHYHHKPRKVCQTLTINRNNILLSLNCHECLPNTLIWILFITDFIKKQFDRLHR